MNFDGIFRQTPNDLAAGSFVAFRKMERAAYSEAERECDMQNRDRFTEGVRVLRKLRTGVVESADATEQQEYLAEAHMFSHRMALLILDQVSQPKPVPLEKEFTTEISKLARKYQKHEARAGYTLPSQFSAANMYRAAEDMLVRVQEKVGSVTHPDHELEVEDLKYVLHQFLKDTNDLSNQGMNDFFSPHAKIGGTLTGGAVYLEMAKEIVDRYGKKPLRLDTFVVAVDIRNKKVVAEHSASDAETTKVVILDDVINTGNTVIITANEVGQFFPKATISSSEPMKYPGEWQAKQDREHADHLPFLYNNLADYVDGKEYEKALKVYEEGAAYAQKHNLTLRPSWEKRRKVIAEMIRVEKKS